MGLTQARAKLLFRYEVSTGKLFWRKRADVAPQWNGKGAGKEAGYVASNGYRMVNADGSMLLVHRVIFLMENGWLPEQVDHDDHDRVNNRINNLNPATSGINGKNKSKRSDNSSGHNGVHLYKRTGKWSAYVTVGGKRTHLGYFVNFGDAVAARNAANDVHSFHENHGIGTPRQSVHLADLVA